MAKMVLIVFSDSQKDFIDTRRPSIRRRLKNCNSLVFVDNMAWKMGLKKETAK